MALNKFMHPRNPYRKPPDFKQLAIDYPEFRKHVKQDLSGKVKLDFKDEGAVRALTESLLNKDFSLCVKIPPNRLVPTLPLRLNYLLWIQDILDSYHLSKEPICGIDIGTGATCIYPLLAAKKFSWSMLATEIDTESVQYAKSNIENNHLSTLIEVKQVTDDTILIGALDNNRVYDFCMCNPPFFSDKSQLDMKTKSRTNTRQPPRNAQSGIKQELVVDGGEIAFVSDIIRQSTILKDTVRIYTVMVGHKCNLGPLKKLVKECGARSVSSTEFCQGRTIRWGLAWTFDPEINLTQVEKLGGLCKQSNKPPLKYILQNTDELTLEILKNKVQGILMNLEMTIITSSAEDHAVGLTIVAHKNTWSHQRRKHRQEKLKKQNQHIISNNNCSDNETNSLQTGENVCGYMSPSTCTHDVSSDFSEKLTDCGIKRSAVDDAYGADIKKMKRELQTDVETDEYEGSSPLLVAVLVLGELDSEFRFELSFIEGHGGREAANQVLQHLKNQLK